MDPAGIATLLTPEGWALLEALPPYDEAATMRLGARLREQGHDPALVAAALTQSRLRQRAEGKFGAFAAGMLFTADGLEQATRLAVGARHAQRYVSAGIERVLDLGCGIGADAMAFASFERAVVAVDQDEATAAVATVNLRHWPDATVQLGDVQAMDLAALGAGQPGTGAWLDPGRRAGSRSTGAVRRVTDPEAMAPPLSFVRSVAAQVPATGAKLAPGIAHQHLPADAEAQWVSVGGEAVECALWWGPLAREGVIRSALVLGGEAGAVEVALRAGEEPGPLAVAPDVAPGMVLHEPDPAVIAAGLVPVLAAELGAAATARGPAYLVGEGTRPGVVVAAGGVAATPSGLSGLARSYLVEDRMPFQVKALRAYLKDREVGTLTVKKRGVAVEPEQLRRQLRPAGPNSATIAVTRVGGQQTVLVLRPL